LNKRQFQYFLEEVLSEYDDTLCYSAVRRWVEAQQRIDFFNFRNGLGSVMAEETKFYHSHVMRNGP
jgi:hypothetical protein